MNFEGYPSMSNSPEMNIVDVQVTVELRLIASFSFHHPLDSVEQFRWYRLIEHYHRDYWNREILFRDLFDAKEREPGNEGGEKQK